MTVILFGNQFTFDNSDIGQAAIELAEECETLGEFTSILYAEEVSFIRQPCKYVRNNATHSDYQLSLLQG